MICLNNKVLSIEIWIEKAQPPDNCKAFFYYHSILLLLWLELAAAKGYRMLMPIFVCCLIPMSEASVGMTKGFLKPGTFNTGDSLIINVHLAEVMALTEDVIHHPLECGWCVM